MNGLDHSETLLSCPLPIHAVGKGITLAHGEGARLTRQLIRERIVSRFANEYLNRLDDAALVPVTTEQIALSSDGYTVTPLVFPGGDIGKLSIFGTVNDLAVAGAIPRWITLSLIIEEGLPWSTFDQILDSIQLASQQSGVKIVTGDTKVVPHGAADKLFITTTGLGEITTPVAPGPHALQVGDVLIVSGPIGCHGAAILCARDELGFNPAPCSDCASLANVLIALHRAFTPRAIRDATRGGLAAVLHEWSEASCLSCVIDASALPVNSQVRAVCELLGLDPVHLANEGTFVLAVDRRQVNSVMDVLRQFDETREARVIGEVCPRQVAPVVVRQVLGREVALDDPAGAPLPRIC